MTPVRFELAAPRSRVSEGVGKYGVQVQSVLLTSNYLYFTEGRGGPCLKTYLQ